MSKSPSLRRIQADIRELSLDPSPNYHAAPLEDDMFEWHFTIRGADGTDFEGGVYHGRILLPPEYPFKPPHIMFLTPSGRFETNTKICLSFTAFHAELWQPAWGIRLILEALISFLPTPADGAIGALDWSPAERKRLAQQSVQFVCKKCCNAGSGCHKVIDLLPKMDPEVAAAKAKKASAFAKEIAELQRLQQVNEVRRDGTTTAAAAADVDSCNTDRIDNNTEISNTDDKTSSRHNAQTNGEVVNRADIQSSGLPVSTTNALLQPPEEEIVFGADDGDVSDANGSDEDRNDGKMSTRPGSSATTTGNDSLPQQATNSSMNDTTTNVEGNAADVDLDVGLEHANNVNNIENDDLTSLYDPLLNLMILLMVVICYLLVQKYMELQAELFELQQDDGVHDEL